MKALPPPLGPGGTRQSGAIGWLSLGATIGTGGTEGGASAVPKSVAAAAPAAAPAAKQAAKSKSPWAAPMAWQSPRAPGPGRKAANASSHTALAPFWLIR